MKFNCDIWSCGIIYPYKHPYFCVKIEGNWSWSPMGRS